VGFTLNKKDLRKNRVELLTIDLKWNGSKPLALGQFMPRKYKNGLLRIFVTTNKEIFVGNSYLKLFFR